MRRMMIALGLTVAMFLAGSTFAADQTRDRSKDHTRTSYQTGNQDRARARDHQKSLDKDQTRIRNRAKDGSSKTTK